MKSKIIFLCMLSSSVALAAGNGDPDEHGIGGTGKSDAALPDLIFRVPELPERIEIPVPPEMPDLVQPFSADVGTTSVPETTSPPTDVMPSTTGAPDK